MAEEKMETTALERIETLIPYKELSFEPKKSMGKLNLASSPWAISAKLGRYLLSGTDPERVWEICRECAAWALGTEADELVPCEPLEHQRRTLDQLIQGPYSLFAQEGNGSLIAVAHDKAKKSGLGDNHWRRAGRLNVMKLPVVLGLMEIVESGGGIKSLRDRSAARASVQFLEDVAMKREQFRELDSLGRVWINPEGGSRSAWATVDVRGDGTMLKFWHDREKTMILGSDEEIRLKAASHAERCAQGFEPCAPYRCLMHVLTEQKMRFQWAPVEHALGDLARLRWDEEACRELNRRFAASEHIAGVFEDKKNCDEAHRGAARSGFLAEAFRHIEIDDDVDLEAYRKLEAELELRDSCGELPQVDQGSLALRFRKCGRHRAIGVYCPQLNAVAVDPRAPRSLLHEFAHAYDFEHGQLSMSAGFAPILWSFRKSFQMDGMSNAKAEYYSTPTEVFARAWECYAALHGIGGSFVDELESYREHPAYAPLLADAEELDGYFGRLCKGLGHPVPKAA